MRTHLFDALLHCERVGRLELELLEAAHEALQQLVRQARLPRAHRAAPPGGAPHGPNVGLRADVRFIRARVGEGSKARSAPAKDREAFFSRFDF